MKKTLLITTALLLTVMAFAQGNRQGFQRPDEATMVKMRTERMAQQLGLDETQTAKLLELNQKYPNAMMGNCIFYLRTAMSSPATRLPSAGVSQHTGLLHSWLRSPMVP